MWWVRGHAVSRGVNSYKMSLCSGKKMEMGRGDKRITGAKSLTPVPHALK